MFTGAKQQYEHRIFLFIGFFYINDLKLAHRLFKGYIHLSMFGALFAVNTKVRWFFEVQSGVCHTFEGYCATVLFLVESHKKHLKERKEHFNHSNKSVVLWGAYEHHMSTQVSFIVQLVEVESKATG